MAFKVGQLVKTRYNSNIYKIIAISNNLFGLEKDLHVINIKDNKDYVSSMFDLALVRPEDVVPFTEVEKILYASIP